MYSTYLGSVTANKITQNIKMKKRATTSATQQKKKKIKEKEKQNKTKLWWRKVLFHSICI